MSLGAPLSVAVHCDPSGAPLALEGERVDTIREQWVVEDRWWTDRCLRRRYFELVLADGRNAVVFCDLGDGRWFSQRA